MNVILETIINDKISNFKALFMNSSRDIFVDPETGNLRHPGEFGIYRERIVSDLLKISMPSRLELGSGFLINYEDGVSTQADIVIHDKSVSPKIENSESQRFFLAETVCGIGEVKSIVSKNDLKMAMRKLSKVKSITDSLSSKLICFRDPNITTEFNRTRICYDQVISFIICEKFDFDPSKLAEEIGSMYEAGTPIHHKHNMILSVNDGLLLYKDPDKITDSNICYPTNLGKKHNDLFIYPEKGNNSHIRLFLLHLLSATSSATTIQPELTKYLPNLGNGTYSVSN